MMVALVLVKQELDLVESLAPVVLEDLVVQTNLAVLEILGRVNLVHMVTEYQAKAAPLVIYMVVVSVLLGIIQMLTVTTEERHFNFINLVSAASSFLDGLILALHSLVYCLHLNFQAP